MKCPICLKPMDETEYGNVCWVSKVGNPHPSPLPVVVPT